ncbi:MAG: SUMF1/EgtB/PvdO family nonheme iron enzyme [Opitutales bacterium]|nr:SUMF1/EgtB/PvdO family nonheme iron enzyme [Opitutales bacterium]
MKRFPSLILLAGLLACTSASATVPSSIHFQGRLTDATGAPVNGPVAMAVRMYDAPAGGTLMYEEDLGDVTVVEGVYSFSFGAMGTHLGTRSELILVTDGVRRFFLRRPLSEWPVDGTLVVSDDVYTWSQAEGSSDPRFDVSYDPTDNTVSVIYQPGPDDFGIVMPEAGKEVIATYDFSKEAEISVAMTAAEHWLALVVDGVEMLPRSRLLAVPYALKARESADAQMLVAQVAALEAHLATQEAHLAVMENRVEEADAQALTLAAQVAALEGRLAGLERQLEDTGIIPLPGFVRVQGGTLATSNSLNGTLVDTFDIGRFEVTWGEWKTVRAWAAANGYDIGSVGAGCADDHPVHSVNWFDVLKWSNAKSEMDGLTPVYTASGAVFRTGQPNLTSITQNLSANGYRLPTGAEWEFAARGGNRSNGFIYAGSNDLNAVGWFRDNSSGSVCDLGSNRGTWPVGQKLPNELGLYDMSGNVWEWCWDLFPGDARLSRGGSWWDPAAECSVSEWMSISAGHRWSLSGFRLVRSVAK